MKTSKKSTNTIKDIEKRNRKFNALSPRQKMVEIQKDILQMINSGMYMPARGHGYVNVLDEQKGYKGVTPLAKKNATAQQELLLSDKMPRCAVCERGAIVLSRMRLGNEHNIVLDGTTTIKDVPETLLDMIEELFESFYIDELSLMPNTEAPEWSTEYQTLKNRAKKKLKKFIELYDLLAKMTAIEAARYLAENFIKNEGRLVYKQVDLSELHWEAFDQWHAENRTDKKS